MLKKFLLNNGSFTWMLSSVHGQSILQIVAITIFSDFIISFVVITLLMSFGAKLPNQATDIEKLNRNLIPFVIALSTLIEELIFRLPLALAVRKWGRSKKVLLVALILSILFGYSHGTAYNILIQGVVGFSFCLLFLKCGGYEKKYKNGLLTSWATHTIYDLLLLLPLV